MIDRYTKIVLTVIAVCLVVLVGQKFVGLAKAQYRGPTHVVVDSWGAYVATFPIPVHPQ